VILEVAGKSVANSGDISEAVKTAHADNKNSVLMRVRSGEGSHYVAIPPTRKPAARHTRYRLLRDLGWTVPKPGFIRPKYSGTNPRQMA
jgi:tRNA splicing endonuclease